MGIIKKQERGLKVEEMKMLVRMCGITKVGKIRNDRWTVQVGEISRKIQERKLECFEHVLRRDGSYVKRRVRGMEADERR